MVGWPDGWMTGWPDDQIARSLDDQMTRRPDDQMVRWPDDQMAGWPEDRMARSPDDRMARRPYDRRPYGQKSRWHIKQILKKWCSQCYTGYTANVLPEFISAYVCLSAVCLQFFVYITSEPNATRLDPSHLQTKQQFLWPLWDCIVWINGSRLEMCM